MWGTKQERGRGELEAEHDEFKVGMQKHTSALHFHGKLGFSLGCVSLIFLDVEG